MIIGIPTEIKNSEYRVGAVPMGVRKLTEAGNRVLIQAGAGAGSGIPDEEYVQAGGHIIPSAGDIYDQAEMIIKVKEPLPEEYSLIRPGQILFTYLHLAPAAELTRALIKSRCIGLAYETIQLDDGSLPLLTPMSAVAGRMASQIGAHYLEKINGGRGVLLGGVPGVERGRVTIIGGGTVGANAAKMAVGLGADVFILDIDQHRLTCLDDVFGSTITTLMSYQENIGRLISVSDLVIGSVLKPGARAPYLVTREMIRSMNPGSVLVDVAIDQGGCFETSRPTTHQEPVYTVDEVIHYCVANIPSMVSRTSTFALTNVTLPYALEIANKGLIRVIKENRAVSRGINVYQGAITHPGVAEAMGCTFEAVEKLVS